jgi:DNA repair exonuclease SbcCD ATPase subunit
MEGSANDLREQLEEREAEVHDLRDQLGEAHSEIDRLRRENEQLRKELKAAGRGKSQGQSERKKKRKRSGRKAGKGPFTFRGTPAGAATSGPAQPVRVTITRCPCCGGELRYERTDDVTVTDTPAGPNQKSDATRWRCTGVKRVDGASVDNTRTWLPINMGRRRIEWGRG